MSDAPNEPVFTGTPDQWWEKAELITEAEAAERLIGDWYISPAGSVSDLHSSYRISTPTLNSNEPRKIALRRQVRIGQVQAEGISPKVRRLIHTEVEPPEWLSAGLVIADREVGSDQRVAWRNASRRWYLLSDGRISLHERSMSQLRPKAATITELT